MLTVGQIKKITKGTLIQGDGSTVITGISIDSRTIRKGNAFVAIEGKRFDGHKFMHRTMRKGVRAVIVSKKIICPGEVAVICVGDTTKALGQIAAWHRKQFDIPVIAVTGSTGKTTTKELIASVLGARFNVLKNVKTENNQYGVALTLLKMNSSHQIAVLELGTNQPGDIRWLAQIVRPTVSVFTNIGPSHLEKLKSQGGVFREKVQLIKYMDSCGSIIVNNDDSYLKTISKKCDRQKIIRFGCSQDVDYKASNISICNNQQLQFEVQGILFVINNPASHNVHNALAAISCGGTFKIRYNDIVSELARFKFHGARQEIKKIGRLWLVDDTYNANPSSFASAISTLDTLHIDGKRIVVCADMLELGRQSKALHESVGRMIAQSAVDAVLTFGQQARYVARGVSRSNSSINVLHCDDLRSVHQRLKKLCCCGDAVLVKGSRGMRMDRTVKFLKEKLSD